MDASNDLKKLDNVTRLEKDVFTFLCPFRLIIYGVSACMRVCFHICMYTFYQCFDRTKIHYFRLAARVKAQL